MTHPHPTGNYVGKERLKLDFSLGENPWGCSPRVISVLRNVSRIDVAHYPDNFGDSLRRALGKRLSRPLDWFCLGTGALGILDLVFRSLAASQKGCVLPALSFPSYRILARVHNMHTTTAAMCPDLSVNVAALVQTVREVVPAATILANPNNPTGRLLDRSAVDELVSATTDRGFLVLDEANVEFCPTSFTDWYGCDDWPKHVIVVRSFSKAHGLASLRIGYAIAHPDTLNSIMKAWVDFPLTQIAIDAACAALADPDHVCTSAHKMTESRRELAMGIMNLGLEVLPSESNYLLVNLARAGINSESLVGRLERQGIGVLDGALFLGLNNKFVRISPRSHDENARLLHALNTALQDAREEIRR